MSDDAASSSSGSNSDGSSDADELRRARRSPSSDSGLSEPSDPGTSPPREDPSATSPKEGLSDSWAGGLDLDIDLVSLPSGGSELPFGLSDSVWVDPAGGLAAVADLPAAGDAPACPAEPPPPPPAGPIPPAGAAAAAAADADAGADASDISYKADKRRRNREAAVRFRKNRKLRDDKIRSELEDLRNREKDWRKREEDWRAREAALQADKDRLQSRVDEFQALFNKHNLASAVSGLCVCVAVPCSYIRPHFTRPQNGAKHKITELSASTQPRTSH